MEARITFLLTGAFILSLCSAQELAPSGLVSAGGYGDQTNGSLAWSVGQVGGITWSGGSSHLTAGIQQPDVVRLAMNIRALLGGPYNAGTGLMNDGLRNNNWIPATEPYTALGHAHAGEGGGEQVQPPVLAITGPDAIVDWVKVELRDVTNPNIILSSRCALVQRDGDVVDVDGQSALRMKATPGMYRVAVRHRNHLPVITSSAVALGSSNTLDLTDGSVTTYAGAQRNVSGMLTFWPGDVNGDRFIRYIGIQNDRNIILNTVGATTPNSSVTGYNRADVNMNGTVNYVGINNDRNLLLNVIGATTPNASRTVAFP